MYYVLHVHSNCCMNVSAIFHKKHFKHTPRDFEFFRMQLVIQRFALLNHFDAISNMYISFPSRNICALDACLVVTCKTFINNCIFVAKLPAVIPFVKPFAYTSMSVISQILQVIPLPPRPGRRSHETIILPSPPIMLVPLTIKSCSAIGKGGF